MRCVCALTDVSEVCVCVCNRGRCRLFFHRIQLLVCIIVACGWYLVLTKKTSELDHVVAFGKRIGEQEVLLFTTACTRSCLLSMR